MSYTFTVETHNPLQSNIVVEQWCELLKNYPDDNIMVQYISNDINDHPYTPVNVTEAACITITCLSLNVLRTIFNIGRYAAITFDTNCYIDGEVIESDIGWGKKRNFIFEAIKRYYKLDIGRYKLYYDKAIKQIDAVR